MKNLILIITFSLSSMIYAQENTSDTITIYDTLYYDNGYKITQDVSFSLSKAGKKTHPLRYYCVFTT